MNYVLIIGAKSDIAKELARVYSQNGYNLYLAARESESLKSLSFDIKLRSGVDVQTKELDITEFESHKEFYSNLDPKPIGVVIVSGYMSEQKKCEIDWSQTLNTIQVNYTGAVSFLNIVAADMEQKKNGFIVGVSSVAGERGRKANYIYGSSKAAFSNYLSGLRNRLHGSKVNVLTVKPGFVATKMTEGLDLPVKLTAKPEDVAKDIYKAQQRGKDILYTKSIWILIMFIIKLIPEWKFKTMNI
jgi:decaprenylphospho-beta-D-erythro-pentofuranosid-2-ulose 2-reductase